MRYVLAVALFLAPAIPAVAATHNVNVGDDFFGPSATSVAKGDTVSWHWTGANDHTVQTRRRQIDRFNSGILSGTSASFSHVFPYAGRFSYYCRIHPDTMRATVTVGTDDGVAPRIRRVRVRVVGSRVRLGFSLSERSVVTARIGLKTKVKTFDAGRRAIRFRGISDGEHRARLSAKDGFGHRGRRSKLFTVD